MFQLIAQDFGRMLIPAKHRELNIYISSSPLKLYSFSRKEAFKKPLREIEFPTTLEKKQSDIKENLESSIFIETYNDTALLGVYDTPDIAKDVLVRLSGYLHKQNPYNDPNVVYGRFVMPDFFGNPQIDTYKERLYRAAADTAMMGISYKED